LRSPSAVQRITSHLLALGALGLVALLLQFDLSRSDAQFLSRPMSLPNKGVLVGFALESTRTHPGGEIGVELYGRRLGGAQVLPTPSAAAPQIEPTPSLARRSLGTSGLERLRVRVRVPTAAQTGAYSLRIRGTAVSFGDVEVVK
jgi:hypothetical protein